MLKQAISYEDFNGVARTEDFFFNLSKAEIAELELSHDGGLSNYMQRIVKEERQAELVKLFKEIVLMAYGQKSDDGRQFIKNEELRTEFQQTNAYSELFMSLATDSDAAAQFITAIIPSNLEPVKQPLRPQDHKSKALPGGASPSDMAEFAAWKAQQNAQKNS